MAQKSTIQLAAALLFAFVVACQSSVTPDESDPGLDRPSPPSGSSGSTSSSSGTPVPTSSGGASSSGAPKPVAAVTAKDKYIKNVLPALKNCGGCHKLGSPAAGAPGYWSEMDPTKSYSTVESRGYIQTKSQLVKRGAHSGPALDESQRLVVTDWLATEAVDRKGKEPASLLSKVGRCIDRTKFAAIKIEALRTTKRANENADQCTGCDKAACQSCHQQGEAGFGVNSGNLSLKTFEMLQANATSPEGNLLIAKYITTDGDQLVPSTALSDKSTVTKTGAPYSHPQFVIDAATAAAIKAFADDAIAKYTTTGGLCL
jgi:mono/diheme cytochrome c family protein